MHWEGIYVEKSYEKAIQYFHKVSLAGLNGPTAVSTSSKFFLGLFYQQGYGVEQSKKIAADYYKEAADQGHAKAQCNLGVFYIGDGLEKNFEEAAHYFKLSADQGNLIALCNLAKCYEKGVGVEKSLDTAFKLYSSAADKGFPKGFYEVGRFYCYGFGKKYSYEQALKYFKLALDNGYKKGKIQEKIKYCEAKINYNKKHHFTYEKNGSLASSQRIQDYSQAFRNTILVPSDDNSKHAEIYDKNHFKTFLQSITESIDIKFLSFHNPSKQELYAIRDAMLKNPKVTFICTRQDGARMLKLFYEAGYPKSYLKCCKYISEKDQKEYYGLSAAENSIQPFARA